MNTMILKEAANKTDSSGQYFEDPNSYIHCSTFTKPFNAQCMIFLLSLLFLFVGKWREKKWKRKKEKMFEVEVWIRDWWQIQNIKTFYAEVKY